MIFYSPHKNRGPASAHGQCLTTPALKQGIHMRFFKIWQNFAKLWQMPYFSMTYDDGKYGKWHKNIAFAIFIWQYGDPAQALAKSNFRRKKVPREAKN